MAEEIKNNELNEEAAPAPEQEVAEVPEKESKKKTRKLEAQIDELNKKIEESAAELVAANDKYLRLAAEYDNFRKRSAKEREGVYADAYADALCALLPIFDNLERAVKDGSDREARTALSLGSYYGGLCLAPVNTAAVHALSYPLGGEYHISHGLANAILLPSVMRFNMESDIKKHAAIARAVGVDCTNLSDEEAARQGVEHIAALSARCGIPSTLTALGIGREKVEELADAAMKVTRLLVNNPREVKREDAIAIYNTLYE